MIDTSASLYAAWFDAMPKVFRALAPAMGARKDVARDSSALDKPTLSFPADKIGGAFETLQGILTQVYHAYLPLLAEGGLSAGALKGMADTATASFDQMLAGLTPPTGGPDRLVGTTQLQLGLERAFGGLAEAFGLGPMRELKDAGREMLVASAANQRAQVEYLALVAQALSKGTPGLIAELQAMDQRGERVESLLGFLRLWSKSVDGVLHDTMQSAAGLAATSKVIRASSLQREQLQKVIGLASDALHLPTRASVDEAYREIQELKRELRRLKKALPLAAQKKLVKERSA